VCHLATGLLTALWFPFVQRVCERTRPPHPPTSPDNPGGYAVCGPNTSPPRCPSADARIVSLSHADQWGEFRELEWGATDSAPKEETTGVTNDPRGWRHNPSEPGVFSGICHDLKQTVTGDPASAVITVRDQEPQVRLRLVLLECACLPIGSTQVCPVAVGERQE